MLCTRCRCELNPENAVRDRSRSSGFKSLCKPCDNERRRNARTTNPEQTKEETDALERAAKRAAEAMARLGDDFSTLHPGDLGTTDDYTAPNYDREKKQEYNAAMGDFLDFTREADPERLAQFVSLTAEQERRWMNKRLARSHSIAAARELLLARQFEQIAERVRWPVTPLGYAAKSPRVHVPDRIVVAMLSDLHFGATLPGYENPEAFDFDAATRRLARVIAEVADYKPQYRDQSSLVLCVAGDVIEGLLGWNDSDNAPLAEQAVAFCRALVAAVQYCASAYRRVRVVCEPGNHGRNKLKHPGRATSSKWDGFETILYKLAADQCRPLPNVSWDIPKAPSVLIPLFDQTMLLTHGDTEHKLGAPGSKSATWEAEVDRINGKNRYGKHVDLFAAGHFHEPRIMIFKDCVCVSNGALVPANGHARAFGADTACGQWIWEATPGYPFGDSRYIRVGPKDDADMSLDAVIPRFEW
jgi:hypothetical protein